VATRASLTELKGTDALAEVMSALQMQGRVYCRLELSGEWAFSMPGDGLARFHVIERGTCWVGTPDGGKRQLAAGDLILALGEHVLSCRDRPKTIVPVQQFIAPVGLHAGSGPRRAHAVRGLQVRPRWQPSVVTFAASAAARAR
jgi:Cupin